MSVSISVQAFNVISLTRTFAVTCHPELMIDNIVQYRVLYQLLQQSVTKVQQFSTNL